MKKISRQGISFQIAIGLIIVWCAVTLLLGRISRLGFGGWTAFLAVPICIILAYVKGAFFSAPTNDSASIGVSGYYSWLFILLAIAVNGSYIVIGSMSLTRIMIAADIVLVAFYLGLILFVFLYQQGLSAKVTKVRGNTRFTAEISRTVGSMIAESTDEDIRKSLINLKEMIDYSTNSVETSFDETSVTDKMSLLRKLIDDQADKEDIKKAISNVEGAWKARNAKMY